MEKDVVCGMQVDPAKGRRKQPVRGEDVLLLFHRLQSEVRRESTPVHEVNHSAAGPASAGPGDCYDDSSALARGH
jgi:hypothetical protein